ncbi:Protein of unknown function [Proteiniborus ethanoligenes]|uniref:UPF0473 protein SAMN05660462_00114 n=1 Tax=Proteiniborus ethanoligenes TaxID=415015 RepID=A0A1H3K2S8_9FIRM|nr:DUF1292 domain-containing protein [Proteiniborus ethanoligenes]TAH61860.1 MAG: DUF1292 domain-containing protein [Gottschalkiaceae bacterium]SDY46496.1 Protein of unknown function [Proteiniborus ethanoligenes]
MSKDDNIISLIDENGKEQDFELMATFEVEDFEYAVLFPLSEEDEEEGAYILRIEYEEDGQLVLINIEDEEEFENVVAAYEAIVDEIL